MSSEEPSTSTMEDNKKNTVEAFKLLSTGKRNLICGEVKEACGQLQEACRLIAKHCGDLADECADAYLCYGKALLDLSRMESSVLGKALEGVEEKLEEMKDDKEEDESKIGNTETVTEEEKEKIADEVIDAMIEKEPVAKKEANGTESESMDVKEEEKKDEEKPTEEKPTEEKKDEDKPKEEKKDEDKPTEEKKDEDKPTEEKKEEEKPTEEKKDAEKPVEEKPTDKTEKDTEAEATKEEKQVKKTSEKEDESEKEPTSTTEGETTESKEEAMEESNEAEENEDEDIADDEQEENGKESDEQDDCPDENEVSNIQLAWEMIELAKLIFAKKENREAKLNIAECHLKLGEISMESDSYENASNDFKKSLEILESEKADARLISETYLWLGNCHINSYDYDSALKYLKLSVEVLQNKIDILKKQITEKEEGKEGKSVSDEIKELEDLIPDLQRKIDETLIEQKEKDRVKEIVKDAVTPDLGATSAAFGTPMTTSDPPVKTLQPKRANDVSHLVKKRKPDEEDNSVTDKSPVKKIRTDTGKENGEAVNGNGDVNMEEKSEEAIQNKS